MNMFLINKFAGAFLASILLILLINGVGNYLIPANVSDGVQPSEEAEPAEEAVQESTDQEAIEEEAEQVAESVDTETLTAEAEPPAATVVATMAETMSETVVAAAGVPPQITSPIPPTLATLITEASIDDGRKVAKKCVACHSFDNGGSNKVGPNLWGVVGAKIARREDFRYSKALTETSGIWGYTELFEFLAKPQAYAPGAKMVLKIKKPEDRANLIVYLRNLSDNPPPLPAIEAPAVSVE